jgi:hypothetical protein
VPLRDVQEAASHADPLHHHEVLRASTPARADSRDQAEAQKPCAVPLITQRQQIAVRPQPEYSADRLPGASE